MIKQLLNSVIAKYCDLSVSRRSIISLCLRLRQIIDLLASDKSRYFAQPCAIIVNYCLITVFLPFLGLSFASILKRGEKNQLHTAVVQLPDKKQMEKKNLGWELGQCLSKLHHLTVYAILPHLYKPFSVCPMLLSVHCNWLTVL